MVLRRIVLPTEALRADISRNKAVNRVSLIAEFRGAQLNGKINPKAFEFEVPQGAIVGKFFVPPHMAQLLNKPAPDFRFTDLDGKPFTRDSLAGKVTLLTFWATWCQPCHRSLPLLEKVREQFKDNPKVAFRAISVDTPNVNNEKVAKTLTELGVKIPALRDSEQASLLFRTEGSVPATFLIGADGSIQDYVMGFVPDKIAEWPEKIKKLLAGEKIFEKPLKAYEDELKEYSQIQQH